MLLQKYSKILVYLLITLTCIYIIYEFVHFTSKNDSTKAKEYIKEENKKELVYIIAFLINAIVMTSAIYFIPKMIR